MIYLLSQLLHHFLFPSDIQTFHFRWLYPAFPAMK
jgi:hypothetical protein